MPPPRFVFSCVAELKEIDVNCFVCGVDVPSHTPDDQIDDSMKLHGMVPSRFPCLPRTQRSHLSRLFKHSGAWFTPEYRPSAGCVTVEADRALVSEIEEGVREFFSTYQIMNEVNRFQRSLSDESQQKSAPDITSRRSSASSRKSSIWSRHSSIVAQSGNPCVSARSSMMITGEDNEECAISFVGKMLACSDMALLCQMITKPASAAKLVSLSLRGNLLRADGAHRLLAQFVCTEYAKQLKQLDLGENLLGVDGGRVICELIASPQFRVTQLSLSSNELGVTAAAILGACAGKSLETLDLKSNSIGDTGAQFFYDMIPASQPEPEKQSWIKKLDLSDNAIGDKGILQIMNCLASRRRFVSGLERISFEQNDMTDYGARKALDRLHKLEFLSKKSVRMVLDGSPQLTQGFFTWLAMDQNGMIAKEHWRWS